MEVAYLQFNIPRVVSTTKCSWVRWLPRELSRCVQKLIQILTEEEKKKTFNISSIKFYNIDFLQKQFLDFNNRESRGPNIQRTLGKIISVLYIHRAIQSNRKTYN